MEAQIRSSLRKYIVATWLSGDERGFDDETDLQQSGVLDSFSTLALVAFLDDTYEVQLKPTEVNAETFRSVRQIARLVTDHLQSKAAGKSLAE